MVTDVSTTYYSGYFLLGSDSYTNSSSLTFGEGFEFINVNNKNKIQVAYLSGKGSYVDWYSGHYVSVGTIVTGAGNVNVDYGRIESSVTAIEGNYVSIGKAEVIGSGTVVLHFIVLVSFGMSSVNSFGSPPTDGVLSLSSSSLSFFSLRGFLP